MKHLIKNAFERAGYRVINANRRWGVNVYDDVSRILPDREAIRCVFDVGANFGQTALEIHRHFPSAEVYSFEPVQSTFATLKQNTQQIKQIRPQNSALGAEEGELEITLYGDAGKSSLLGQLQDTARGQLSSVEKVRVDTVDRFVERAGISQIDLLKTDTEGYDIEVLRGATAWLSEGRISLVYSEFHHFFPPATAGDKDVLGNLADINALLAGFGYDLLTVYTDSVNPVDRLGTHNALFAAPGLKRVWRN